MTAIPAGLPRVLASLDTDKIFDARTDRLVCTGARLIAPDVGCFSFRAEGGGRFAYRPGQFATLELPLPSGPEHRSFTLSSSPSRPLSVEVTAKAQGTSRAARWMIDSLRPGMRLKISAPAGRFTLEQAGQGPRRVLFVSAGSGATPMMSMLRWLHDCEPGADVAYLHAARRPEDILFRPELELMAAAMPNLSLAFLVSRREPGSPWSGATGRLDAARLALLAPDLRDRDVFCCGPEPFMAAVASILEGADFPMVRFHRESFGAPVEIEVPGAPAETPGAEVAAATIRFALSAREVRAAPGQSVLQAARGAGVRIPAACESGLCGTCKVSCAGPIDMRHNGGILDEEIADGFILACCSRPSGDIVVEA